MPVFMAETSTNPPTTPISFCTLTFVSGANTSGAMIAPPEKPGLLNPSRRMNSSSLSPPEEIEAQLTRGLVELLSLLSPLRYKLDETIEQQFAHVCNLCNGFRVAATMHPQE